MREEQIEQILCYKKAISVLSAAWLDYYLQSFICKYLRVDWHESQDDNHDTNDYF